MADRLGQGEVPGPEAGLHHLAEAVDHQHEARHAGGQLRDEQLEDREPGEALHDQRVGREEHAGHQGLLAVRRAEQEVRGEEKEDCRLL